MTIFSKLSVAAVGKAAQLALEELAAAGSFASLLFCQAGNADGRKFVAVAIDEAGESLTEGTRIQFVGLAFAVESNGRDEKGLRTRFDQLAVQREAEAATFLDAEDLKTFGDPLADLIGQLLGRELSWWVMSGVAALNHGHNEGQMNIQTQLDLDFMGINHRSWQRLSWRQWAEEGRGGFGFWLGNNAVCD